MLNTPWSLLAVSADKAYSSEKVPQQIKEKGVLPVIPNRSSATNKGLDKGYKDTEYLEEPSAWCNCLICQTHPATPDMRTFRNEIEST